MGLHTHAEFGTPITCKCTCASVSMEALCINPNAQKSYKISQNLRPKHAARGVAQLPYPIYSQERAYLSKQLLWRAAGDLRLARCRSWVRVPAPAGVLGTFFSPPSLPSFLCLLGGFFFAPSAPVLRVMTC